jgi:hypothetical protein
VAEAFDGGQNLVLRTWSTCKGFGFLLQVDEGTDVGLELPDGGVNTSLDLLSGKFSEPALDLIDP